MSGTKHSLISGWGVSALQFVDMALPACGLEDGKKDEPRSLKLELLKALADKE